ncbi:MAG TPA: hypothetical protein VGD93_10780, partial [Devosia sp.]
TLAGLEAMGGIERRDGASGRSPGLHLSARARATLPRALDIAAAIDRRALAGYGRTERALLLDQLAQLGRAASGE